MVDCRPAVLARLVGGLGSRACGVGAELEEDAKLLGSSEIDMLMKEPLPVESVET